MDPIAYTRRLLSRQVAPRFLDDAVSEALTRSLERFGDTSPEHIRKVAGNAALDVSWRARSALTGATGQTFLRGLQRSQPEVLQALGAFPLVLVHGENAGDEIPAHTLWPKWSGGPAEVHTAVDALPEHLREAIQLLYFEPNDGPSSSKPGDVTQFSLWGLNETQAAERLGITRQALRGRRRTALKRLKELLHE